MKNNNKKFFEFINLYIEIDTEKRTVIISDRTSNSGGGIAKRYRNKRDIIRIFSRYLYNYVYLYPPKKERN